MWEELSSIRAWQIDGSRANISIAALASLAETTTESFTRIVKTRTPTTLAVKDLSTVSGRNTAMTAAEKSSSDVEGEQ